MRRSMLSSGLLAVMLVTGCGGGGALDGTWTRAMSGEGDVTMTVKGSTATIQLPEPRWPAADDYSAKLALSGETLTLSDEKGPTYDACAKPAPTYTAQLEGNVLRISGGGGDPCGGRRVAIAGTWQKS